MIGSGLGRAAFRIGFYIAFVSGILSLLTEPDTAERVISVVTFITSALFIALVVVLVRLSNRPSARRKGGDE